MSETSIDNSLGELIGLLKQRCPHFCPSIFPSSYCPKDLTDLCSTSNQQDQVMKFLSKNGYNTDISNKSIRFITDINSILTNGIIIIKSIILNNNKNSDSDNEIDTTLGNLEDMMSILTNGNINEINILRTRFIELNQLESNDNDGELEHRAFVEAYNIAYAIKIIISNMPIQLKLLSSSSVSGIGSKKGKGKESLVDLPFDNDNDNDNDVIQSSLIAIVTGSASASVVKESKSKNSQNKKRTNSNGDSNNDSDSDIDNSSSEEEEHQQKRRRKKKRGGK